MIVLGLDMATKTGWCLAHDNGEIIESGVQEFALGRGESPGMRFLRFRKWIQGMVECYSPGIVAYEKAHFRGGAATELCVGFQTRAQECAAEENAETAPVATTTLKKWATGKGNSGKGEMIVAAERYIGHKVIDDNHADAILICLWACSEFGCLIWGKGA